LNKYAQFLPVPVQFGTKKESIPDGEDEEGKPRYKSVDVDNIINNTQPIWVKSPTDLKERRLSGFLSRALPVFQKSHCSGSTSTVDYPFKPYGSTLLSQTEE
jgi:molecular chaperone HtpG